MPTAVASKLSAASAAKRVAFVLELGDTKRVGVAIAEAAAQEIDRNPRFAELVRTIYAAIPATAQPSRSAAKPEDDLKPAKLIEGREINPAAPLDPYFLCELYGPKQLRRALDRYPAKKVQEAAAAVEEREPGTKPRGARAKAALVDYIVGRLAPDY